MTAVVTQRRVVAGRAVRVMLVVVPCLVALTYLAGGVGYVLDDWWLLRNADVDGAWAAAGEHAYPRPGGWLLWAFQFGVLGVHPAWSIVLLTVINVAAAVQLHRVLLLVVPESIAHLTALLWVVLPAHTSLEIWHSCSIVSASLALGATALLLGRSDDDSLGRLVVAGVLAMSAVMTYEAIVAVLFAAALVVPSLAARARQVRPTIALLAGTAVGGGWSLFNRPDVKAIADENSDLTQVVQANFGWGVLPEGMIADLVALAMLLFLVVAAASPWLESIRLDRRVASLAAACLALLVLGAAPFVRYPYAPLGAGDRANYLSAIGGALAWALVASLLWRWRAVAAVGIAVLLVVAANVRYERTRLWSAAGEDAHRVYEALRRVEDPPRRIVLGPAPVQYDNIAAFVDGSNARAVIQLAQRTDEVGGDLSYEPSQFETVPPRERFDMRPYTRLDDVAEEVGAERAPS